MSPIAVRMRMRRWRRHAALLAMLAAVAVTIAAHHSMPAMGGMHHGPDTAAVEMCLGVFTAVGAVIAAVALGIVALGRWRPIAFALPTCMRLALLPPQPRTRAGPSLLTWLCVSRC